MRTKDRLAGDLSMASAPVEMVQRAKNGYYDDYESELADPINQLVEDCRLCGLDKIAYDAQNGAYDGTKAEAAEWWEKDGQRIAAEWTPKDEKNGTN